MIHLTNGSIVQCTHILDGGFVNPGSTAAGGEIIVTGKVTYELKNRVKVECPVASLGRFVKGVNEGWCQAEYYEVYLDSAELGKAIVEMVGKGWTDLEAGLLKGVIGLAWIWMVLRAHSQSEFAAHDKTRCDNANDRIAIHASVDPKSQAN